MINKMGGDDLPDLEGVDDEVCFIFFSLQPTSNYDPDSHCRRLSSRNPRATVDVDVH